jgi:hypothetical protein
MVTLAEQLAAFALQLESTILQFSVFCVTVAAMQSN